MAELPTQFSFSWLVICVVTSYLIFKILRFGHREKDLPPGPPTVPILGNAHLLPTKDIHFKLKEWSDQYGPVFSLKVGKSTIVVLNDRKSVHDLMDKRSALYAGRPDNHQMYLATRNENWAIVDSGDRWRASRKVASQLLTPQKLDGEIASILEAEIAALMYDLLEKPKEFRNSVSRTTGSVASIIIFGHRAPTWDSMWVRATYQIMANLSKVGATGTHLPVDEFPFLKLIPERWRPAHKLANQTYQLSTDTWFKARQVVEKRRKEGDKRDSWLDRILNGEVKFDVPMTDVQTNNFLGAMIQAATDTTATAMLTNILHLAKYPEVQDKARVELDRVCGTNRTPQWSDFPNLPYINCIVKEGLRIQPVAPAGVPHRAKEDDWYGGMLIPKGATVFIAPYSLHYSIYSEPSTYNPDRFLNRPKLAMAYASSPDYENRDHYSYGVGRRICVGIHFAERTQWRMVAKILWAFKIELALDDEGKEVELDVTAYDDGLVAVPMPYKVRFTPRSEKHAEIVRKEFGDVEKLLKQWE